MPIRRFTLVLALLALLTAGVSAHDAPSPKGFAVAGYWRSGPEVLLDDPIVQEAAGLETEELRAALSEGRTLSELIEANDGDVESVIASLAAERSEAIESQAAASIESLEENLAETLNERYRRRFPWWRRRNPAHEWFGASGMADTIMDATGLEAAELNTALRESNTIAELVEANDGDVQAVLSTLVEQGTEGIQEAAAAYKQHYEEAVAEAFEADFSDESGRRRKWRPRHGAFFGFWGVHEHHQPASGEAKGS